jgi:putative RecB family exonuclease
VAELYEIWLSYGLPLSLEGAMDIYRWFYARDTNEMSDVTPNFDWWFWSGPYNGERDIERRYDVGLEQVEKFLAWREHTGQEIWITPDGTPAIEIYFEIELDGILVRGFIDAVVVIQTPAGTYLRVRDYKTGNTPGDDFQLGVYALAIEMKYGIRPSQGDYFMVGKKGVKPKLTPPKNLSHWTREAVTERFREVEDRIQAGDFEPDPEPGKCGFCDVNYSCPVFQG